MELSFSRTKAEYNTKKNKMTFGGLLLFLIMVEIFTGGGGDFYSFHIFNVRLTLRIVFFIALIFTYILGNSKNIFKTDDLGKIVYFLVFYNFLSMIFGVLFNNSSNAVSSFLSSFYLIAFLPFTKLSKEKTASFKTFYLVLLVCAFIIATITLSIYVICTFQLLSEYSVYRIRNFLDSIPGDWWMRANGAVAYPSQTFVAIAALIILSKTLFRKTNFIEILLMTYFYLATISTNTRGLIASLLICSLVLIIISIFKKGFSLKIVLILGLSIIVLFIILRNFNLSRIFSLSDQSGGRRVTFLSEGFNKLVSNPLYIIFGSGFGSELPSTGGLNLEISLFEILLEQGLIGVTLWVVYTYKIVKRIHCGIKDKTIEDYKGFGLIIAIAAIFIESFTNPYLNNTIGIICFFLCYIVFCHEKSVNQKVVIKNA